MPANDLVIRRNDKDLCIDGMVDVDAALKLYVGVDKMAAISLAPSANDIPNADMVNESNLKTAVMHALLTGQLVDDKHVKFAHPITIKNGAAGTMQAKVKKDPKVTNDIPLASDKLERIFEPQSEPNRDGIKSPDLNRSDDTENTKRGSAPALKVSIDGKFAALLQALMNKDAAALKKVAGDFGDRLLAAIDSAKVDGKDVGIDAPMRIQFSDAVTRDMFLSLGKGAKAATAKQAAVDKVAKALAATGLVRTPITALVAQIKGI
jgi:hypothetical protein